MPILHWSNVRQSYILMSAIIFGPIRPCLHLCNRLFNYVIALGACPEKEYWSKTHVTYESCKCVTKLWCAQCNQLWCKQSITKLWCKPPVASVSSPAVRLWKWLPPTTKQSGSNYYAIHLPPSYSTALEFVRFQVFWSVGIGSGQHNFRRYRRSQQILKGYR